MTVTLKRQLNADEKAHVLKTHGRKCFGVELLPDCTFVTTTYGHWTEGEPPYIVSVRFKLHELDAKLK